MVSRSTVPGNEFGGLESFHQKRAILDGYCTAIGRDPQTIVRSTQLRVTPEDLGEVRNRVHSYAQAGVTHLILSLHAPLQKVSFAVSMRRSFDQ
jgi:hypothetical protein